MGAFGALDLPSAGSFAARPAWGALFLCALTLTATLTIAIWAWRRRAASPAAAPFAALALAQAVWNAGHLAELASSGLAAKIAWDCFETLPAVATGFFMLMFAARYTGRRVPPWLMTAIVAVLAVPTLVIVVAPLAATTGLRAGATLEPPYGALLYDFTSWDIAYLAAVLAVALAAIGLLIGLLVQQRSPFRAQTAGVAIAIAFPIFFGFGWLALDLRLQGERDVSHVAFAVSSLVTAWTLSRGRLFDLVPVAREAVFEHLTDAVLVIDRAGRVVDANPVAAALLHAHPAGGVGRAALDVLEAWPGLVPLIGSDEARQQEVPSPSSFGRRWYDARWAPLRDRAGRWLGGTLVLRDVSTLRQARIVLEQQVQKGTEDLAVSEERFHTLFDQTFQLISLVERDGTLLAANRAALEMIDADLPAVLGRPLWETPWWTHDAAQQARLRESLARAAEGEFVRFDATHMDGAGKRRAIDFSLMPVRDARGQVVQIIPEGRDVTAVQEAHARAAALAARLQQAEKLEAIGRVAAGVAHDFNNLLTVISASIDVARRELPPGSPAVALLGEALQAVDSAAGVTRQLLTFSRKQPALPRRLSITETLMPIEAMLRRLARPSTIPAPHVPAELWSIFMDAAQLQQILMNLIVNARDAMPNGGAIVISAQNVTVPVNAAASARPAGEFVRLDVRDAGQGMTEEVRAHVFEPFFTTKPEGEHLSFESSGGLLGPRGVGAEYRVEDGEELSHAGDEGDLGKLAGRNQAGIEGADDWVEACSGQSTHVEHRPDVSTATPNKTGSLWVPLSRLRGATPTRAASCFLPRVPSSGSSESSVRESTLPTPGTLRSRSSFSRQTGEPLTELSRSVSISSSCFSSHLMVRPIAVRTRLEGGAARRRFFSAVIMSTTWRRRTTRASSSCVCWSLRGRSSGRMRSAKSAKTAASIASVLASFPVALAKSLT